MIELRGVTISNGGFTLRGMEFAVPRGAYAVLMGPTGCGKTTLLEAICGLKRVVAGTVGIGGRDVTRLRPSERDIGLVPQDAALFSTMSVRDNIGFALRVRGAPRRDIDARVESLAASLGISHLLARGTAGLSGGEAQRVALGRALAANPAALCLDEPLNALDAETKTEMIALLRSVPRSTGVTVLHVTHDEDEAGRLADVRFRFDKGAIVRQG